jgi:hypothetical protein
VQLGLTPDVRSAVENAAPVKRAAEGLSINNVSNPYAADYLAVHNERNFADKKATLPVSKSISFSFLAPQKVSGTPSLDSAESEQ